MIQTVAQMGYLAGCIMLAVIIGGAIWATHGGDQPDDHERRRRRWRRPLDRGNPD